MKRNVLFLLFLWLGTNLKGAKGLQLQAFHIQTQGGPDSNLTVVPDKVLQVCQPGWTINDDLVCIHSNYQVILLQLSRKGTLQQGWHVFCPMGRLYRGSCQLTPPDSQCMKKGYIYIGNLCDFTKFHEPHDDAFSNQTSDPDEDSNYVKYIAISIFVGAFLFPCGLGICCYYCGEDDDREASEDSTNHIGVVEHSISVIGRNPSYTTSELELQNMEMSPPSYDVCNEAIDVGEKD